MRKLLHKAKTKAKTPIGTIVLAASLLLVVGATTCLLVMRKPKTHQVTSKGTHLVTIHDRGVSKTIVTKAKTIAEALKEDGVTLDGKDTVEPDKNQEITASQYQVNIYRARPVVVVEGNVRTKIMTPYQTAAQIAESAGIVVYPEDVATVTRSDDISDGAGLKLTIKRATAFNFTLYGSTFVARTQGKTVGEMLKEKKITLTKDDRVSPDTSAVLTEGMEVKVWREGKQTITVTEAAAYDTETIEDANQKVGYVNVKKAGVDGEKNVTYEIVIKDGKEVSRTVIASIITKQPVTEIKVVGTASTFSGSFAQALAVLRACESGGNYANKNNPLYRGAYQYGYTTWGGYGGYYDPADAPAALQDQKAWETYQARGWSPWPNCGASLPDIYR